MIRNSTRFAFLLFSALLTSLPQPIVAAEKACGHIVTIATHDNSTTRYALSYPKASTQKITLVLLAGGAGHLELDDQGCPHALKGNSLVRSIPLFNASGFITALVDAPSDHHGVEGLGGFRIASKHADDLGKIVVDLRARTKGQVWVVGTSRGSISAANAAARLSGPSAPDGVVLTSAVTSGQSSAKKPWVAQTVFELPLEKIQIPILVIGHAADTCVRTPAGLMPDITARTNGVREQVVTITGGPEDSSNLSSLDACEGRSPHGYIGQEAEVVAGIARFIRDGMY